MIAVSTRDRLFSWLAVGEDGIYLVAAGLLAATAAALLASTAWSVAETIQGGNLRIHAIEILDTLLLVIMLVEILHTIRVTMREHTLVMEPFLIVGLIASVRRILILTAEAAEFVKNEPGIFRNVMIEMGLLTLLILVLVVCVAILRWSASRP